MNHEVINSTPLTDFSEYMEFDEEDRIPYETFLKTRSIEVGKLLVGVKPKDLFTYQTLINDNKIINVMRYVNESNPLLNQITGYIHHHTKFEKNVIVIGNGNHRSLYAILNNLPINVAIKENPERHGELNPFRITNNIRKYGDSFGSL